MAYLLLSNSASSKLIGTQVSPSTLYALSKIANNNTLANQVGLGVAQDTLKKISAPPFSVDGRPEIFYVGGEFCPYCAVTRWGLILALMRFGNFTSLEYMQSSSTDVDPNTVTFSFANSTYSSMLVHFDAFEIFDRQENPINASGYGPMFQSITARYNAGIPFIDFANASIADGASVSPQYLGGESWSQVIASLNNSQGSIAQAIIGNANLYTKYICMSNATLNSTANACRQPYLKSV